MMISLRRSLGSKFCAGLFIVLIVLPFTAPFRAWDAGAPFGKPSNSDLKAPEDLSNSVAVAAGTTSVAPVIASDVVDGRAPDGRAMGPSVLRIVLRL